MNRVYLMYKHRLAAGRGKVYAEIAQNEAFPWLTKLIESGLIKDTKVLKTLSGKDGFILMLQFDNMADAHEYLKSFEESGIAAKYQNVLEDTETMLFEEFNEEQSKRYFETISTM